MFLLKRVNFNKSNIIKGLCAALFFSAFIYLEHFGVQIKLINSLLGLFALYLLLTIPKNAMFFAGFFIGIFWFYWISFSFIYYDLPYVIPLVILGFAIFYGVVFYLLAIFDTIYYRIGALFVLSYLSFFGFNWLQVELLFIHSYFGIEKIDLLIILVSLALVSHFNYLGLLPLVLALNIHFTPEAKKVENPLKIAMPQLNLSQNLKWKKDNQEEIIEKNLRHIDQAISQGYDLIILPETAFPLLLNTNEYLWDVLQEKAQEIDIITGALYKEKKQYFNSSYHFSSQKIVVANKVVLVPFGEEIPLPKIIRDFINNTFYNGAQDYAKATEPTDFDVQGVKFRNAICYETTTHKIFEDLGDVQYMVSISNNAWFTPSVEPTLQKLLMQYYAKLYNVTIYASANGSPNLIIGK